MLVSPTVGSCSATFRIAGSYLATSLGGQLVGAAVAGPVAVDQGKLVEALAGWRGVLAGDAGPAQSLLGQADAAGHGLQGQVEKTVGTEVAGHGVLLFHGRPVALHEAGREQFPNRGHVD